MCGCADARPPGDVSEVGSDRAEFGVGHEFNLDSAVRGGEVEIGGAWHHDAPCLYLSQAPSSPPRVAVTTSAFYQDVRDGLVEVVQPDQSPAE
jgi:hypothetical protein